MAYADSFVLPVPKRNKQAYLRVARKMGKICREHGALMKDKRLASMMDPKAMPFDGKRMFWGGFKVMVDL